MAIHISSSMDPDYPLLPGHYEAVFSLMVEGDLVDPGFTAGVVASSIGTVLAKADFHARGRRANTDATIRDIW